MLSRLHEPVHTTVVHGPTPASGHQETGPRRGFLVSNFQRKQTFQAAFHDSALKPSRRTKTWRDYGRGSPHTAEMPRNWCLRSCGLASDCRDFTEMRFPPSPVVSGPPRFSLYAAAAGVCCAFNSASAIAIAASFARVRVDHVGQRAVQKAQTPHIGVCTASGSMDRDLYLGRQRILRAAWFELPSSPPQAASPRFNYVGDRTFRDEASHFETRTRLTIRIIYASFCWFIS
jgi:hypothetical protein